LKRFQKYLDEIFTFPHSFNLAALKFSAFFTELAVYHFSDASVAARFSNLTAICLMPLFTFCAC
jgi:hypothetical protein